MKCLEMRELIADSRRAIPMFEINCPSCGAEGRASKQKVNTRLVCRKCLRVFHVTPAGRAVPGEPPVTGEASLGPSEPVEPDRAVEVDQWFERISKTVFSTRALLVVVGLIVLMVGSWIWPSGETLEDRVRKVGYAAYDGDTKTLQSLAASGTEEDVIKWYEGVRAELQGLKTSLGPMPPSVEVVVKEQDADKGVAQAVARISTEQELSRRGAHLPDPTLSIVSGVKTVELPMTFDSSSWGGWRIDGKRTFEALSRTP